MSITTRLVIIVAAIIIAINISAALLADSFMQAGVNAGVIFAVTGSASASFGAAAIFFSMSGFLKPLMILQKRVNRIADGDIGTIIALPGDNEIGRLAADLNRMINSFNSTISGILLSANAVVAIVDTLQNNSEKTATGAKEQSEQASRIAAAAEQMTYTIREIERHVNSAAETSAQTRRVTARGRKSAVEALKIAGSVTTNVGELEAMMTKLNAKTREIAGISTLIKDIADQTNLLALNAAIEAARAGDRGRGFAVVADEVRKLAEKTISSTGNISVTVKAVSRDTEDTAKTMCDTSREVSLAAGSFSEMGKLLQDIDEKSRLELDQINLVAAAMTQQHEASEEVTRNIEKTAVIAQETEKMSGLVMAKINELSGTAEKLFSEGWKFRLFAHHHACDIVADMSGAPEIRSMLAFSQETYLKNAIARYAFIELVYITDSGGCQVIDNIAPAGFRASYDSTGLGMNWSGRPWFTGAVGSAGPHITDLYRSEATGSFCFTVSSAIRDESGRLAGVLGIDISLAKLLMPEQVAAWPESGGEWKRYYLTEHFRFRK